MAFQKVVIFGLKVQKKHAKGSFFNKLKSTCLNIIYQIVDTSIIKVIKIN